LKHRRTKEPTYENIDKKQERWLDAAAGTTTIRLVPEKVRFSEEEAKEKGEGVEAEKHGEGAAEDSKLADPDEDGATARRAVGAVAVGVAAVVVTGRRLCLMGPLPRTLRNGVLGDDSPPVVGGDSSSRSNSSSASPLSAAREFVHHPT
jgi:hypothetical protein